MYGLTKNAYRNYVKNQTPFEKEKKPVSTGGLLSPNINQSTVMGNKPMSIQEQEKNVAKNAFALFKNFNDRYRV